MLLYCESSGFVDSVTGVVYKVRTACRVPQWLSGTGETDGRVFGDNLPGVSYKPSSRTLEFLHREL
jgi:hypothetical protein